MSGLFGTSAQVVLVPLESWIRLGPEAGAVWPCAHLGFAPIGILGLYEPIGNSMPNWGLPVES